MKQEFELTTDQQTAIDRILPYMRDGGPRPHLLAGYAGTGKTFLMKMLLAELPPIHTVVCAPTHKALKVIRRATAEFSPAYNTIQSLLMVKPAIDARGKRTFKSTLKDGAHAPISNYKYIIVDETSMLDDILYNLLMTHKRKDARILFIGDPAQLPPVSHINGLKSKPFRAWKQEQIVVSTLREIVRQKGGSNIILMSMEYRNKQEPAAELFTGEVGVISRLDMMKYAYEQFNEHRDDQQHLRILAYTNNVVNDINYSMHVKLFPGADMPLCKGELMVLQEPYPLKGGYMIPNAEELIVETVNPHTFTLEFSPGEVDVSPLEVNGYVVTAWDEVGELRKIRIAEDYNEVELWLERVKKDIVNAPDYVRRYLWSEWYKAKDSVADWKHGYAQTIHKSQGSTYHTAIIMLDDVRMSQRIGEPYWELMYTAVTRPSNKLLICN